MKHSYIEENQIADQYVLGRLAQDESERFESHFLHCKACQNDVRISEKLQQGMHDAFAPSLATDTGQRPIHRTILDAITSKRGIESARPLFAAAASVLLVFSSAISVVYYRAHNAALAPSANTPILRLYSVRSATQNKPAIEFRLPNEPRWMVLAMELSGAIHPRYRAALRDSAGQSIWSGENLVATVQDEIILSLHSSMLAAGDFEIQVEGITATDTWHPVARFAFRVTNATADP